MEVGCGSPAADLRKMNPDAVSKVYTHVKQQPYTDQSELSECYQNTIQHNGSIRMQWYYSALKWKNKLASCPSRDGLFSIQFKILHPSALPEGTEQLMYGMAGSPAIDL